MVEDYDHDRDEASTVFSSATTPTETVFDDDPLSPGTGHSTSDDARPALPPNKPRSTTAASSSSSSIPVPGNTYILRTPHLSPQSPGYMVLTLSSGCVTLLPSSSSSSSSSSPRYSAAAAAAAAAAVDPTQHSYHWTVAESKGWLSLRNPVSGKFLGHDNVGNLVNRAGKQHGWENMAFRHVGAGGYVMMMTHFERLWVVGAKKGAPGSSLRLAKMEGASAASEARGTGKGLVWEFVKV
ncbi:hypothetical protein MKZ38_003317 [Zalerion maritima]|uniref:Uncharacterized protein n=1 Tax=Zalerion maritima TaxID=339359 RepID=A0AAD5WSI3_9PEZI|nr:hypothetical protein MKZ38_003317 [Zalerion maritima]